jgi:hypothetical protein
MQFEKKLNYFLEGKEGKDIPSVLMHEDFLAIESRADFRRLSQRFKKEILNLKGMEVNEEVKKVWNDDLAFIFREAGGEEEKTEKSSEIIRAEIVRLKERVQEEQEIFPDMATYFLAKIAKLEESAGLEFETSLAEAKKSLVSCENIARENPSAYFSDAMILGIEVRRIKKTELPSKEKIAEEIKNNPKLIFDYALVLPESEREGFLKLLPEEKRREFSVALDSVSAEVLHASLIEKDSEEGKQRKAVVGRLRKELYDSLNTEKNTHKQLSKVIAQTIGELGEDARQILLEAIRDESENRESGIFSKMKKDNLPRVLKVMLDNFDDLKANDLILRLAGNEKINPHLSYYLLRKLVKREYLQKEVESWWKLEIKKKAKNKSPKEAEVETLDVVRKTVSDLGIVPTKDVLEFLSDDKKWQGLNLDGRIEKIKNSQKEFSGAQSQVELVKILRNDENKAMMYFLLNGGRDRFNLINNYSFEKFKEMISLIGDLKVHKGPISQFEKTLKSSGENEERIVRIIEKLKRGEYPLENNEQAKSYVNFEVSENSAIKNANHELGQILGKNQLGVLFLFPLYREYLGKENNELAKEFVEKMKNSHTFSERLELIGGIENRFGSFKEKALAELEPNWKKFGEKMVMEMGIEQILTDENIAVKGEEILPRLDSKRIDLKKAKKEILVALKGENKAIKDISNETYKKKRALQSLNAGLERAENDEKRNELREKIDNIKNELDDLERRRQMMSEMRFDDRFSHLGEEEKKEEIGKLAKEISALTEKSPSAIFTYLIMQVLGEEKLTEGDIALIQEFESHIQSPFQTISDNLTYRSENREQKGKKAIQLEYLNKKERLLNMVRFADSKICCFSSSNYEMQVQHSTPNKYWVASINADPMSFVISMENEEKSGKEIAENLGFIFGNFAVNEHGKLALMLNGIYYAPGVDSKEQVQAIMDGVEKIFKGLPIETIAIASQYGG